MRLPECGWMQYRELESQLKKYYSDISTFFAPAMGETKYHFQQARANSTIEPIHVIHLSHAIPASTLHVGRHHCPLCHLNGVYHNENHIRDFNSSIKPRSSRPPFLSSAVAIQKLPEGVCVSYYIARANTSTYLWAS